MRADARPRRRRPSLGTALAYGLGIGGAVVYAALLVVLRDDAVPRDRLIVGGLGACVGGGEVVSRYRDAPMRALTSLPGIFYVVLNAVVAVAALGFVRTFDLKFGLAADTSGNQLRWVRIIAAGTGAMAVMRSALFTVRAGEQDVAVGPAGFLQIIMGAVDREVDRKRAQERAPLVNEIMFGIAFEKAVNALPAFCFALMQNLDEDDQERFGEQLKGLRDAQGMADDAKCLNLGLALMNVVGEEVLRAAVEQLRPAMLKDPPAPAAPGAAPTPPSAPAS
jgi:hypothetical protein